jgi:hypothetical protein
MVPNEQIVLAFENFIVQRLRVKDFATLVNRDLDVHL